MNTPHDMGGRTGDGPVIPAADGIAPFGEPWHRTALALTIATGWLGAWSIDASRHAREGLADYARLSYYQKWIHALADLLVQKGLVSRAELAGGPLLPAPSGLRPVRGDQVAGLLSRAIPYTRSGPAPAFAPGDLVRTRSLAANTRHPGGHTRLPAYCAGKVGRVILSHGAHVFPDSNAHGTGEAPEPLYTVAFAARALWGDMAQAGDEVSADLWQSYLERA